MSGVRFTNVQDSGRLGDFDYSDEDIDSLRKQMRLHEPQSPQSSLSDEIEALGTSLHLHFAYMRELQSRT